MAANKRISKDFDLAAGFFSDAQAAPLELIENTKEVAAANQVNKVSIVEKPKKYSGGRPKKEGLRNEQFTLTLHPEVYEKIKILATDFTGGNFSRLVIDAIQAYCEKVEVNFDDLQVDQEILQRYMERQDKKFKNK